MPLPFGYSYVNTSQLHEFSNLKCYFLWSCNFGKTVRFVFLF
jgi:hypothetical protein